MGALQKIEARLPGAGKIPDAAGDPPAALDDALNMKDLTNKSWATGQLLEGEEELGEGPMRRAVDDESPAAHRVLDRAGSVDTRFPVRER